MTLDDVAKKERDSARGQCALRIPSAWLKALWDAAVVEAREARWNWLPEEIAERVGEIQQRDVAFLCDFAGDGREASYHATRAAVRALGHVGERCESWRSAIVDIVPRALENQAAGIRQAAAEALWQVGDPRAKERLRSALERETNASVRATLQGALASLEQTADD